MASAEASAPPSQPSLPFPLQDGERVIKVCRRHWIYLWPRLIGMVLAAVVPTLLLGLALDDSEFTRPRMSLGIGLRERDPVWLGIDHEQHVVVDDARDDAAVRVRGR